MRVTIHTSMDDLPATDWNGLAGDDPFLSHEFLAALEHCGSTTPETGWQPQHLACRDATGRLIGALPLYLKSHSYGEYVFDWSWAEAWQQAGLHYYPKLVSAVPFSPVPGQRLLIAPDVNREAVAKALLEASTELAQTTRASSIHSLFPVQNELPDWTRHGFLLRKDCQFHWHNHAKDHDFESWLARFTAHKRKKVHRERRRVREAGIRFRLLHGCDLDTQRLDTVHRFYAATYLKRGRSPYLNRQFFDEIARTLPENLLVILA
ncbi:MAG TPA: peptidogalycan biosysnthesis protein, partial [Gammaproteobacteria bacterium]|nr:peptidogalycan biosysnthesis protein [Gammaproteobacteria bacterium]